MAGLKLSKSNAGRCDLIDFGMFIFEREGGEAVFAWKNKSEALSLLMTDDDLYYDCPKFMRALEEDLSLREIGVVIFPFSSTSFFVCRMAHGAWPAAR